jgi:hypothetical protein
MAEDVDFVRAHREGGAALHGPLQPHRGRGRPKDEAKRTALEVNVSVTPGINDATARTLPAKVKDQAALEALDRRARPRRSPRSDAASPSPTRRRRAPGVVRQGHRRHQRRRAAGARCRPSPAECWRNTGGNRIRIKASAAAAARGSAS